MGAWSKAGDCSGGGKGRLHGGGKLRARDRRPAPERTRHHMTGRYLRPRNPRSAKPPVGGRGGATSGGGGSDAGGGARAIARSRPGHNAGPILPSRLLQRPFGAVCRAARWLRRPRELGLAGIVRRAALLRTAARSQSRCKPTRGSQAQEDAHQTAGALWVDGTVQRAAGSVHTRRLSALSTRRGPDPAALALHIL